MMKAGQAHAWLFISLVNDHLRVEVDPDTGFESTTYAPVGCGPCGSLAEYWLTPVGRADAQVYLNTLSREDRDWSWAPKGHIDWDELGRRMKMTTDRGSEGSDDRPDQLG
jgi:hypothetical protein